MRTQMRRVFPETTLERVLAALERELVEATDEEILEAAHELGMKPEMKGSAAFLGLRYPSVARRAEEFFGPGVMRDLMNDPRRLLVKPEPAPPPTQPRRPRRAQSRGGRSARTRLPKEPGES